MSISANAFALMLASASPQIQFSAPDMADPNVQASVAAIQIDLSLEGVRLGGFTKTPPDRFNHAYPGIMHIRFVSPDDLITLKTCAAMEIGASACTIKNTGTEAWIVLPIAYPMDILSGKLDALFFHERAHAEGWPADHPKE